VLLKLASPGVPDIYQGNEIWDFSLVDPDNRRPVDYERRISLLGELQAAAQDPERLPEALRAFWRDPHDGRAKLYLTWRALQCRAALPEVFERGAYVPLEAAGERADHVCAFARAHEGRTVVVAVGRWFTRLERRDPVLPVFDWGDTRVSLPLSGRCEDVLTGERRAVGSPGEAVRVAELFAGFPVALLVGDSAA
jgi:(1->4)-alpha-D-glucan 1-alpha-D-glucosylmutase